MSADNWAICPRCMAKAEGVKAGLEHRVRKEYGVIPVEEFDALRVEAARPIDERSLSTFREDYEIYGAAEGEVVVIYDGGCTVCGLELKFRESHPIPGFVRSVAARSAAEARHERLLEGLPVDDGVTDEAADEFVRSHGGR